MNLKENLIKPIRVLYIVSDLLEGKGGIQSLLISIYQHIERSRVQIDFVVHGDAGVSFVPAIKKSGSKVYQAPQLKKIGPLSYIRWWNQFFNEHPEYMIVHGHMKAYISLYLLVAKLHGRITIAHSHSAFPKMKLFKKYYEKLALFPLRWIADYHFACSTRAGEYLYGKHITTKKSFHFIPNARETEVFTFNPDVRNKMRHKLGLTDCWVVGHVGNFLHPKNHHFLLQIFAEIYKRKPNARLLLIGDGVRLERTKEQAKQLHVEKAVLFMGLCSNPQDYYQAMDVFVLPSFSEGLPLVLVEAQISGLPCMMSAHLPQEVDFECGLLHKTSLAQPASVWAEKLLSLPIVVRRSYSKQAAEKGFEITSLAQRLENFYIKTYQEIK